MKTLKFLFITLFVSALALTEVNAQAVIVKDDLEYWAIPASSGWIEPYDVMEVYTPDGTVYFRVNAEFPLDDPWIVEAILYGKYTIDYWYAYTDYGWIPIEIVIFPNGRVKITGHFEMEPDID